MRKAVTLLALALSISLFAEDENPAPRIVNDGVTIDDFKDYNGYIKSGKNTVLISKYVFILGRNNTINLNSADAVNGVYTIYAGILATNGAFTVNAEGIDTIRWMGSVDCPNGSIIVTGAKKVVFGDSAGGIPQVGIISWDADIESRFPVPFFKPSFISYNRPSITVLMS